MVWGCGATETAILSVVDGSNKRGKYKKTEQKTNGVFQRSRKRLVLFLGPVRLDHLVAPRRRAQAKQSAAKLK
jgi:hypothetical protein